MSEDKSVLKRFTFDRPAFLWIPTGVSTIVLATAVFLLFYASTISLTPCGASIAEAQSQCEVGDDETFTGPVTLEDTLSVGATPSAGTAGYLLESQGASSPPEWVQNIAVAKTANEIVNNLTTLQQDDHFTFAAAANASYVVEMTVIYETSATADLKIQMLGPGGSNIEGHLWADISTGDTTDYFTEAAALTLSDNSGSTNVFTISAIVNTSATAGDVNFFWAQNTGDATDTTFYIGSTMTVRRVI
jgi:hypothetical protein